MRGAFIEAVSEHQCGRVEYLGGVDCDRGRIVSRRRSPGDEDPAVGETNSCVLETRAREQTGSRRENASNRIPQLSRRQSVAVRTDTAHHNDPAVREKGRGVVVAFCGHRPCVG